MAVVGAGWAGLGAAVHLARHGARVVVIEAASIPGGRARSFRDVATGETLDSGQHLMLGCYHATIELLRLVGTDRLVRPSDDAVPLYTAGARRSAITSVRLPGPLHMLPTMASACHLDLRDRLGLGRVCLRAAMECDHRAGLDRMSALEWLIGPGGQGPESVRLMWEPLVTAMLNEEPGRASAAMLVAVLRQGLLAGHSESRPLLSLAGLGDLVALPATRYVSDRGGDVLLGTRADGLRVEGRSVRAVRTGRGDVEAGVFVLAVPSWRLGPLLAGLDPARSLSAAAGRLDPSPIVTVHLRYRRPILCSPMAGLLGGHFQWVFDRNDIRPGPPAGLWSYSAVASACRRLDSVPGPEIASIAAREIEQRLPGAPASLVESSRVLRSRRATFSPAPGTGALRPQPRTRGLDNLLVAGDWTATGLPATLEGAVGSGRRCADLARELLGGRVRFAAGGEGGARNAECAMTHG